MLLNATFSCVRSGQIFGRFNLNLARAFWLFCLEEPSKAIATEITLCSFYIYGEFIDKSVEDMQVNLLICIRTVIEDLLYFVVHLDLLHDLWLCRKLNKQQSSHCLLNPQLVSHHLQYIADEHHRVF
jgi:hypothetical protein